ncbi:MAG TPA: hypothetical protein DCQ26_09890 [Marinilabiliales bacterium]|nr:MAG: hypothetical protein A2W95_11895 [Bacteroidetes bacterium GWA2_40_14]OFZ30586.1 MAG: hypothetical protein A2437_02700 [Bacteroidetes bacterium RIFOXYC2_FULL_40_12]HAM98906.1 hypothetical protein [Marinilabiliales bacterium]HAZ03088.1 hypothetical protein [Marinilabiliales bacterium]HBO75066.1 hypothetical protein [Marinilabiliales bacterium]
MVCIQMQKKLVTCIILLLVFGDIFSQNANYSSLPMFDLMYYNPGYAGDGNEIEAKGLFREQWMKFPGRPRTQTFSIDAPFKLFNHQHGAGLTFLLDNIGNFSNTYVNLSYAYRRSLAQGDLGIGASLNMLSHKFESDWRATGDVAGDVSIPQNKDDRPFALDVNLGVFYRADNLYLSVSTMNVMQSRIKYTNSTNNETASSTETFIGRQFFISTGYDYQLANPMFSVQPSAFIASDISSTQFSLSGILTYNQRFFGGLGYKKNDAVIVIAGIDLPSGIEVAVSYDVNTSRIIKSSAGSFEFMVGYSFSLDIDKDSRKFKSVRFL